MSLIFQRTNFQTIVLLVLYSKCCVLVNCGVVPWVPIEPEFNGEETETGASRLLRDLDLDLEAAATNSDSNTETVVTTDLPPSSASSPYFSTSTEQIIPAPSQSQIKIQALALTPQIEIIEGSDSHHRVIEVIRQGLTQIREAGDRLRKFVEKIENGIETGQLNQSIQNVKTKIENGEIDFDKLVTVYNQKSPLNLPNLIQRISDDSHVLLNKLHGKIDAHIKSVLPKSSLELLETLGEEKQKIENSQQQPQPIPQPQQQSPLTTTTETTTATKTIALINTTLTPILASASTLTSTVTIPAATSATTFQQTSKI